MRILTVPTLALAALTMSVTFGAPTAGVSAQNVGEKFTAFAINMNSGPKTATVDIKIDRWSTDAEREQLSSILVEEKDCTGRIRPCSRRSRSCRRSATFARRRLSAGIFTTRDRTRWRMAAARSSSRPIARSAFGRRAISRGPWTIRLRSSRCG